MRSLRLDVYGRPNLYAGVELTYQRSCRMCASEIIPMDHKISAWVAKPMACAPIKSEQEAFLHIENDLGPSTQDSQKL